MKNSLRIHKWTHNEFNIFILGVLTHPLWCQGAALLLALLFESLYESLYCWYSYAGPLV